MVFSTYHLVFAIAVLAGTATANLRICDRTSQFLPLGVTDGVRQTFLPRELDGFSDAIHIPIGFPFGVHVETVAYVGINGYISFRRGVSVGGPPAVFPISGENFLVAPFWARNDIRLNGNVSYEVHNTSTNSGHLQEISNLISENECVSFTGTWMLLVEWKNVHPYPDGIIDSTLTNTFQAAIITSHTQSYAVFTYNCSSIQWTGTSAPHATIGYYADGNSYRNHEHSGTSTSDEIDCENVCTFCLCSTVWNNEIYRLDDEDTHTFRLRRIGETYSLPCTPTGLLGVPLPFHRLEWAHGNGTTISEVVSDVPLGLPDFLTITLNFGLLNDTVHQSVYVCRGYRFGDLEYEEFNTILINVSSANIVLMVIGSDFQPHVGEAYMIQCNATEPESGLSNRANLILFDDNDQQVVSDFENGITVTQGNVMTPMLREAYLFVQFDILRISNAQNFTCMSVLISPALSQPLIQTLPHELIVRIPSPLVTITVSPTTVLFAGNSATLTCTISLNEAVGEDVVVAAVWRKAGVAVSNSSRIMVSNAAPTSSFHYESTLTFSTLSMQDSTSGNDEYSCEVTVDPVPLSAFIVNGTTGSDTESLSIQVPTLTVTTSPTNVDIINAESHNTFTIECTATVPDSVVVPKTIQWERVLQGTSAASVVLTNNGDNVTIVDSNLNSPMSTSTLTVTETAAGIYTYTCNATLQALPEVNGTSSSCITVRGPVPPDQPVFENGGMTDVSSYQIEWLVPRVAYTLESYMVWYGTSAATLDRISETIQGNSDITSMNEHYSVILRDLDPDTTFYFQIVATNSFDSTTTNTVMFTTQSVLIVALTLEGSINAGSTYTVICTVTDTIDGVTPTIVWLDPSGVQLPNSAVPDAVVNGPTVNGATTTLELVFSPLQGSHQGDYTCRANITASGTVMVMETQIQPINPVTFDIPVSITITSTPMPEDSVYQAASSVTLTCEIDDTGTFTPLTYQWTSTCLGDCFVRDQTSPVVSREGLRSIDAGSHTCTVTDDVGNTGSSQPVTITVMGVGLYLNGIGQLPNNSVVIADSTGMIGDLQCISASEISNTGQFISPSGQDISNAPSMPFDIVIGDQDDPGHVILSVAPGQTVRGSDGGIYSCIIPDEEGVEQTIQIGIYGNGFNSPVTIDSLERSDASTFTLNCTSSGSPPTTVTWVKDGSVVSNDEPFQTTQTLCDGTTSTYDNFLMVDTGPIGVTGTYMCRVSNDISQESEESITVRGLQVTHNGNVFTGSVSLVFTVNSVQTISCSTDLDVMRLVWMLDRDEIASSSNQQLDLVFDPVNDTIHNQEYTCMAISPYGSQEQTLVLRSLVLFTHLNISIRADGQAFTGEQFSLTCVVTQAEGLTSQQLSIQWLDSQRSPVATGDGVSIQGPIRVNTETTLTLNFDSLNLEHSEEYTCLATLPTEASVFDLEREAVQDVNVVSSQFIEIDRESAIACEVGAFSEFNLTCKINIFNPAVSIERIDWRRTPQGSVTEDVIANGVDIVIASTFDNPTSTSVLIVSRSEAGSYMYTCVAVLDNGEQYEETASTAVTIRGTRAPVQPTAVTATDIMSQSVTISWTIPLFFCIPEEYIVQFRLSTSSLDQNGDIVHTSDGNPSVINARFSVQLMGLMEDTVYFYRVVATNSIGQTSSVTNRVTTDSAPSMNPVILQEDPPVAAIAGAIVGIIVIIVVAVLVICFVVRRRRKSSQKPEQTAIGFINPGVGNDPVLVGMEANKAYDTVGRWSNPPPAASSQYRGNSLLMLGSLPPLPYDTNEKFSRTEPIYEKTYENADEMIPLEGGIASFDEKIQQSEKEDNRSYLQLVVEAPSASTGAEMQPHPQPMEVQGSRGNQEEEVSPLHPQARDYDVPLAVTKVSPLINGMGKATKGEDSSQP